MVVLKRFIIICSVLFVLCPSAISAKDFIDPDVLVRLNPKDYELDLEKERAELNFKVQSAALYLNQEATNLQARLYEIKNGEKVFLSSSNSRIEPRSKNIYIQLNPGYFDSPSKDILLEIYDEKNNLVKDFSATISASNLEAQVEAKLASSITDPNTKLIEDLIANKLVFETQNRDPFTVRVIRNEDDTYKVLLPISRIISEKGHKNFIPKSINKHQQGVETSELSAHDRPKALISVTTATGLDFIALTALTAGQADIARIVQDGSVNNSTINNATIGNSIVNNNTVNGLLSFNKNGSLSAPRSRILANVFNGQVFNGGLFKGRFSGDGSALTNITATNATNAVNATNSTNATNLTGTGSISGTHDIAGKITFSGIGKLESSVLNGTTLLPVGSKISGNVQLLSNVSRFIGNGSGLTNIPASAIIGSVPTNNTIIKNSIFNNNIVNGALTFNKNGSISAPSSRILANVFNGQVFNGGLFKGRFSGDGSGLTNIPGSAIIGTVPTTNTVIKNSIFNNNTVNGLLSFNKNGSISAPASRILANVFNGQVFNGGLFKGRFSGDGSGLTNLQGTNIVGNLTNVTNINNVTVINSKINNSQVNNNTVNGLLSFTKNGSISAPRSRILANVFNGQVFNGGLFKGRFSGEGSGLTNITGANVTGTVANATNAVNATTAGSAATVTNASQPSITTLTNLTNVGTNTSSSTTFSGDLRATRFIGGSFDGYHLGNFKGNGNELTRIKATSLVGVVPAANLDLTGVTLPGAVTANGSALLSNKRYRAIYNATNTVAAVTAEANDPGFAFSNNKNSNSLTATVQDIVAGFFYNISAGTISISFKNTAVTGQPRQERLRIGPAAIDFIAPTTGATSNNPYDFSIGSSTSQRVNIKTLLRLPVLTARSQFPTSPVLGDIVLYKPANAQVPRVCLYFPAMGFSPANWLALKYSDPLNTTGTGLETQNTVTFNCN